MSLCVVYTAVFVWLELLLTSVRRRRGECMLLHLLQVLELLLTLRHMCLHTSIRVL
jgi:hypothetical protein